MDKKLIINRTFDEERALYDSHKIELNNCSFDGPADGESALKESSEIKAVGCYFNLRYPFWHDSKVSIEKSEMTELCRAALWYCKYVKIHDTTMHGIKALRECKNIVIKNSDIVSPEFGWSTVNCEISHSSAESEYFMMRSKNLRFDDVTFKGKYSFQYVNNAEITDCRFNTKDAFWHTKNVTVKNSVINGEYLAWYSDGLTLINCKISGTQPFCYCKNLRLINCEMNDTDLCFEKSEVEASITTPLISIKNPASGTIQVPKVGAVIMDDIHARGRINLTGDKETIQ